MLKGHRAWHIVGGPECIFNDGGITGPWSGKECFIVNIKSYLLVVAADNIMLGGIPCL